MLTKKQLAIKLSKLTSLKRLKINLEQYVLDSEIAAEIIWRMHLNMNIEDKIIADLGCGNGILGYGCLLFKAKKVYFVDKDKDAINTAKENVTSKNAVFFNQDVNSFSKKSDIVVMNPPFGTKREHVDREFLLKAFETSKKIYSLHKITSVNFIEKLAKDNGFRVLDMVRFFIPLRRSYNFHTKKIKEVDTGLWILEKHKI
ncbi:methyltransferase [Candidatus Woesearchaeota archaeon]|nr:methyltransferase [Candidatus Woesearchaeota archaeon]